MVHGTPSGYDAGCRGVECANHRTDRMTCREAHVRFQGDYAYRAAVKAGTATDAKESFVVKAPRIVREPADVAAKRAAAKLKPIRANRTITAPRVKVPRGIKHGTKNGADKGCKTECPAEIAGGLSCLAVRRRQAKAQRDAAREVRLKLRPPGTPRRAPLPPKPPGSTKHKKWVHGTRQGFVKGHCKEDCPAEAAGRDSCRTVARTYNNNRDRSRTPSA